jgi:glycogen(starch) synthase
MNVALFPSAFHPSLGGVEELVRQLAHQLQTCDHSVMIATNRWPKSLPEVEQFEGLDLHRYICRVPERTWKQMGGSILLGPGTLRQICADLRAHRSDVLHIQCVSSSGYYALRAARRLKLPLVVTLQGELTMDPSQMFQRSEFAKSLLRDVLTQADIITGCSAHTLAEGEAFFGKPFGSRGRVVHNGVRCEDFRGVAPYRHPRPYLFALGRHAPQKGFDVLLRALARLKQEGEESHDLLLAGDGPERQNLEKLAGELGLGAQVKFVGRANHEEAVRLFLGSSFFVLSSRADEGLPVVSVEALAAGKAIVATRSGGTPEAVQDGVNGLIVPKDDELALTGALRRMIREPEMRDRMGEANAAHSQAFDWSSITDQYLAVYQEARRNAGRPGGI